MAIENTHYGAKEIGRLLADCRRLFFIGIGGISMSALACLSVLDGYAVGGSDRIESPLTRRLEARGICVYYGHDAAHLADYDAVIYTVAIGADNPEYRAALAKGLPLISRADYLGYLISRFTNRIGIAGMHGKSTCTAMCAEIFAAAADPTVFCGAEMPHFEGLPCRIGVGREHVVFEACEYMDSFLDFAPSIAVVLNIGMDHVDYFHSMEQIYDSFHAFAARTQPEGVLLWNIDDANSRTAFSAYRGAQITFGFSEAADFRACNIVCEAGKSSYDLYRNGTFLCHVSLPVAGMHNVTDSLAAASAALLCGLPISAISQGLADFGGARRRMEYKGRLACGAAVYDDYAHHPDEIRATLAGAKVMGYRRILCAYQPHTYSRTAGLLEDFSKAFGDADRVLFADIYAARESNLYGVTSKTLADRIGEKAIYCGDFDAVAAAIKHEAKEGDLVIVMGAGDIFHVFDCLELS